jgi:flagellar basal-body rod modification protein FlgD
MDIARIERPAETPMPRVQQSQEYLTFLNMLTVQMRNQDPLNPMSSTDFAVQLATFSSVEQQVQTNQLLTRIASREGFAELGHWVGMEARVAGGLWFSGDPVDLAPDPILGADRVELVVRDAFGTEVDRRMLPAQGGDYRWQGISATGFPLPHGRYQFDLLSYQAGDVIDVSPVAGYQRVQEVRIDNGEIRLVFPGGDLRAIQDVSGLRRP